MKVRYLFVTALAGVLLIFASTGICQQKLTANDLVEKIGQGSINWTAGYVEAAGIGIAPDQTAAKINARPVALRAAKESASGYLLEMVKNVQVDSARKVKDFMLESDAVNAQINGIIQRAVIADQLYMPDGTVEVKIRVPLYGELSNVILPAAFARMNLKNEASSASAAPPTVMYSGIVVDARGIRIRPVMIPKIFDEAGKEIYGLASVDIQYAVRQGVSGYVRDLEAAKQNQRVAVNPLTVKGLKTTGAGKTDIIISNADAAQIKNAVQSELLLKQCRVLIVAD
ncbi:MAG: hypothetical protein JW914_07340 [Syntrophaceae bacterium]|nr:hypothetical protein [Syntrophaceae bacterium]